VETFGALAGSALARAATLEREAAGLSSAWAMVQTAGGELTAKSGIEELIAAAVGLAQRVMQAEAVFFDQVDASSGQMWR